MPQRFLVSLFACPSLSHTSEKQDQTRTFFLTPPAFCLFGLIFQLTIFSSHIEFLSSDRLSISFFDYLSGMFTVMLRCLLNE